MKTEHRKELQQNTLETSLKEAVQRVKQGPSKTTTIVLALVGTVVLIGFLLWYFLSANARASSALWVQVMTTFNPSQAEELINDSEAKGTRQAQLARLKLARFYLQRGERDLGSNPDDHLHTASEDIRKAAEEYEKVLGSMKGIPLWEQEALLGAGKARETRGEITPAKRHYERLVQAYPDSAAGNIAKQRLKALEDNPKEIVDLAKELKVVQDE